MPEQIPWVQEFYKDWCKRTNRNGGVLIGSSIRELLSDMWQAIKAEQKRAYEDGVLSGINHELDADDFETWYANTYSK